MSTIDELRGLDEAWVRAEADADVAALEALAADDFVFVGPAGFVLDKRAWLAVTPAATCAPGRSFSGIRTHGRMPGRRWPSAASSRRPSTAVAPSMASFEPPGSPFTTARGGYWAGFT